MPYLDKTQKCHAERSEASRFFTCLGLPLNEMERRAHNAIFSTYLILLTLTFLVWLFSGMPASGAYAPGNVLLDVDELRPGMKGYGKTVFSGDKIEEFDVEILGILKNWETKNDMILVKLSGGPLEKTGVISGMSGSPVYVEDKVIGAVSYGWGFAKEPIAGVTPIREMLKVLEAGEKEDGRVIPVDREPGVTPSPGVPSSPESPLESITSTLGGLPNSRQSAIGLQPSAFGRKPKAESLQGFAEHTIIKMVPIKTPLVVGGFDQRVLNQMSEGLERYGLFPVQGGGSAAPVKDGSYAFTEGAVAPQSAGEPQEAEMVPGAAIATILAKGDVNASAIGTLTYRHGDSFLAFGHPFMRSGKTDIPIAGAHVHAVIPIQSTSLKLASPTKILGRIFQDSKAALAGTIGEFSPMIPCTVKVMGEQEVEYNFEVVKDRFLTQNLLQWASESALLATERQTGDKTVRLSLSIEIEGRERPVKVENTYYEPHPTWFPVYHITQPINLIMNNQFQEVSIKRMSLEARVSDERRLAYIEDLRVESREVSPGETIKLFVTIRPFGKEPILITIPLQIPQDVAPGSIISVDVCNADTSQALERSRMPEKFLPTSLEHLIKILEGAELNTNLVVRAMLPKRGITYRGHPLPSLPPSLLAIMSSPNQSGIGRLTEEVVCKKQMEWVLQGSQTFTLIVKEEG